jgi:hypothetical protein
MADLRLESLQPACLVSYGARGIGVTRNGTV